MENLERQRKETYTIRELWMSLQQRRVQKHRSNSITPRSSLPSRSAHECGQRGRGVFKANNGSGPFIEQYKQEILQEGSHGHGSFTDRGDYRGSAHRLDNDSWEMRRTRADRNGRGTESAPCRLRKIVRDEDIPYHTIITKPPERSKTCVEFKALNQKLNCGLPNIYDTGYRPPGYTRSDIREWKNEIKKIVPERPTLFLPASTPLRPLSTLIPPETERTCDTSVMFRSTRDRNYGKHMEYMVDPEWFSEKITVESVRNRAHCVYTWNV